MRDDPAPRPLSPWRRYRRFVAGMAGLAVVTVAAALGALAAGGVVLRPAVAGAVALGVGGMLVLAGALMGLVFVSAASGHDDTVDDRSNQASGAEGPWGR